MPTSKKPRKAYRPKRNLQDPVGQVLRNITPLSQETEYLLTMQMKNSMAMARLLRGVADRADMLNIFAMSNVVEALHQAGIGGEYLGVSAAGKDAIKQIGARAKIIGRYTPTGPEIAALRLLMELHDAQTEVITEGNMDQVGNYIREQIALGKVTTVPLARERENS